MWTGRNQSVTQFVPPPIIQATSCVEGTALVARSGDYVQRLQGAGDRAELLGPLCQVHSWNDLPEKTRTCHL